MSEIRPDQPTNGKNRKRILEPSEENEDGSLARKQTMCNEWAEGLNFLRNPAKKGFSGSEKDFTDLINQGLANTFDDSLHGLGLDDGGTYDMTEQISALCNVALLKQEITSPSKTTMSSPVSVFDENAQSNTTDKMLRLFNMDSSASENGSNASIYQLLHQTVYPDSYTDATSGHTSPESFAAIEDKLQIDSEACTQGDIFATTSNHEGHRFQYILGAATSVATKINEESLTYLNQGQPYEIKVKKLGDITKCQGKLYHTKIRICFHERRLQYMEKEHLEGWKQLRPGERIAEIDVPLSYGATDIIQTPRLMNCVEFDWDPSKEVGIYIKVNCVSTEFTPKKHGGEKGVPFRIQVETYSKNDNGLERLHVCACQIKVFKLKGAERKHKQDKEKIQKKPYNSKDRYQEQCECTILQEIVVDSMHIPSIESEHSESPEIEEMKRSSSVDKKLTSFSLPTSPECGSCKEDRKEPPKLPPNNSPSHILSSHATPTETAAWLVAQRFSKHCSVFSNFSGSDIMKLSRAEMREICGVADGIRLYNALHCRTIAPRLTLYVCCEREQIFNALYLENITCEEFVRKVCTVVPVPPERVVDMYLRKSSGIDVLVTDQVLANMEEETMLAVHAWSDGAHKEYRLFLRPVTVEMSNA